ncbi:hypothetical protein THTE_3468 [Thermogutta terrifontis]|uniref:Uncharacterized protein n=1 Tax=Thermogutta terrifontis TaxID=1331910 RepID=A0A286RJD7_9BACT|nr:hypothetical protein THTE_3468 [Thermogutta terrifontis]
MFIVHSPSLSPDLPQCSQPPVEIIHPRRIRILPIQVPA